MSAPDVVVAGMLTGDHPTRARGIRRAQAQLGGGCVYAATRTRVWTSSVAIAAVAGRDYPQAWIEELDAAGIDVAGVSRVADPHAPTLLDSEEEFDADAVRRRDVVPHGPAEVIGEVSWTDPEEAFVPRVADLPGGYLDAGGIHVAPMAVAAVEEWVGAVQGRAVLTLDNPWWQPGAAAALFVHILSRLDALLPSEADISDPTSGSRLRFRCCAGSQASEPTSSSPRSEDAAASSSMPDRPTSAHRPVVPRDARRPDGSGRRVLRWVPHRLARTGDPVLAAVRGSVSASAAIEFVRNRRHLFVSMPASAPRGSGSCASVSRPRQEAWAAHPGRDLEGLRRRGRFGGFDERRHDCRYRSACLATVRYGSACRRLG